MNYISKGISIMVLIFIALFSGCDADSKSNSGIITGEGTAKWPLPFKLAWQRQWGTSAQDLGLATASDSAGNVYAVTSVYSSISKLLKYNSTGSLVYEKNVSYFVADVVVDDYDNVYLLGNSYSTSEFFIKKYTSGGSLLWTKTHSIAVGSIEVFRMIIMNSAIYVVGNVKGGSISGYSDILLYKCNTSGNMVWYDYFGSTGYDVGFAIAKTANGDVLVGGYAGGSIDGKPFAGITDAFISRYSSSGSRLWTVQYGSQYLDVVTGIVEHANGYIYAVGVTHGTIGYVYSGGQGEDFFVSKIISNGVLSQTYTYGSSGDDYAAGIALDSQGYLYVAGSVAGSLHGSAHAGGDDAFVLKLYSSLGVAQMSVFGTVYDEQYRDIYIGSGDNVHAVGHTKGSLAGLFNLNQGDYDVILMKNKFTY